MAQRRRLVLGIGNRLVGEDGFGAAVVEALHRHPDALDDADVRDAGTDLLSELGTFGDYHEVVLVDVVLGGGPAGEVAVIDDGVFSAWPDTSEGCHGISPLLAVKVFRLLQPHSSTRFTLVALHTDGLASSAGVPPGAVEAAVACVKGLR